MQIKSSDSVATRARNVTRVTQIDLFGPAPRLTAGPLSRSGAGSSYRSRRDTGMAAAMLRGAKTRGDLKNPRRRIAKERALDPRRVAEILQYEPVSGVLYWKVDRRGGQKAGAKAGSVHHKGYIQVGIDGTRFKAHRLIWCLNYGVWPSGEVDHIDQDKTNNRLSNLREVCHAQNQQNQTAPRADNKSGRRGVSWHKKGRKWIAQIAAFGRYRYLGLHETREAAEAAYLNAKRDLHIETVRMA